MRYWPAGLTAALEWMPGSHGPCRHLLYHEWKDALKRTRFSKFVVSKECLKPAGCLDHLARWKGTGY